MPDPTPDTAPGTAPDATPGMVPEASPSQTPSPEGGSDQDVPREQPFLLAIFVSMLAGMTLGFIGYSIPELATLCLAIFFGIVIVAFLTAYLAWHGGKTRVLPPFLPDEPPGPPPGIEE